MKAVIPEFLRPIANQIVRVYLNYRFCEQPIIIGGAPRSGTSLLLAVFGAHPHIHAIDYETTACHPRTRPEKLFAALFFETEKRKLWLFQAEHVLRLHHLRPVARKILGRD